MEGIFARYKIGIMDASFFDLSENDNLFEEIKQIEKIYVSTVINQEYWQFSQMFEGEKLENYQDNFFKLRKLEPKKAIINGQCKEDDKNQFHDTYKLALYFSSLPAKSVLITANKLLIQKVVIKNLALDVYDLNSKRIIPHKTFIYEKDKTEYRIIVGDSKALFRNEGECGCDSTVYTDNGEKIKLTASTGKAGFEAEIYKTDKEGFCAKIFFEGELTLKKMDHIKNLAQAFRNIDIPWFCVPKDVLYLDEKCTNPVGYLETYIEKFEHAINTGVYDSDELIWKNSKEFREIKLIDTLELCLKLVRQVALLNCYGVCITDLNPENFAIAHGDEKYITMWDTDSFAYGSYYNSSIGKEELLRKYDLTKKLDVIEYAGENLYKSVFGLLSLAWGEPYDEARNFLQFVPKNLYDLIDKAINNNYSFSVERLLEEIADSCAVLTNSEKAECTYAEIYDDGVRQNLEATEQFIGLDNQNRLLNCEYFVYKRPNLFTRIYNRYFK